MYSLTHSLTHSLDQALSTVYIEYQKPYISQRVIHNTSSGRWLEKYNDDWSRMVVARILNIVTDFRRRISRTITYIWWWWWEEVTKHTHTEARRGRVLAVSENNESWIDFLDDSSGYSFIERRLFMPTRVMSHHFRSRYCVCVHVCVRARAYVCVSVWVCVFGGKG